MMSTLVTLYHCLRERFTHEHTVTKEDVSVLKNDWLTDNVRRLVLEKYVRLTLDIGDSVLGRV